MLRLIEATVAVFEVGHGRSCNDIASTALRSCSPISTDAPGLESVMTRLRRHLRLDLGGNER